ncbi:MAG: ion transporter [Bacteroidetes bacterium]|nr:ion transporter [Bacteroidota bacterium]MCY4205212.1 ion transporter [Bacteroidota bacterium]
MYEESNNNPPSWGARRGFLNRILFESTTPLGRGSDIVLFLLIVASVVAVMLESIDRIRMQHQTLLIALEWGFTVIFTVEYILRLYCSRDHAGYARSFFGVVDLVAVIPTYLSLVIPGAQALIVIRILRLLRVFRVLKLVQYSRAGIHLLYLLRESWQRIWVFVLALSLLVTMLGSMIYLIEGPENGFESIPLSMYWAVVTLTTVGYGDISPQTPIGKFMAAMVMVIGYAIIVMSISLSSDRNFKRSTPCIRCRETRLEKGAAFCKHCGHKFHQH